MYDKNGNNWDTKYTDYELAGIVVGAGPNMWDATTNRKREYDSGKISTNISYVDITEGDQGQYIVIDFLYKKIEIKEPEKKEPAKYYLNETPIKLDLIKEVEEITGIPSSTIQRYLSREDYFKELAGEGLLSPENVPKALKYTQDWLKTSKRAGLSRGGKTSQERYGFQKTEDGKFNGHSK